ncbi:MAG TPA: DUF362 domain-containing protein, partial [Candidatus Hydrogenedentes bacterium]|nr:DUF362 domain-containing protein [Candidatus Hydrogenedentota bacterium]
MIEQRRPGPRLCRRVRMGAQQRHCRSAYGVARLCVAHPRGHEGIAGRAPLLFIDGGVEEKTRMAGCSRRAFLQRAVLGAGGLALGPLGCSSRPDKGVQIGMARWGGLPENAKGDARPAGEIAEMAERLTGEAMKNLGGMQRFVHRGDVVWIKPNIGFRMGEAFAANTNPNVVTTLARLCYEAGAKHVKVGDHSCYGADGAYPLSGIEEAAKTVDAEVVYLDMNRFKEMAVNGEHIKTWPVYPDILEADLMINVPILKTHGLTGVTACLKNLMGLAGGDRNEWHDSIVTCLCDFAAFVKPRIHVLDAVRALDNGPMGGELNDVRLIGTVVAGVDPVAMDAWGAKQFSLKPLYLRLLRSAR